jgi:hypothetical protein
MISGAAGDVGLSFDAQNDLGVGPEYQELTLSLHFPGDLNRLSVNHQATITRTKLLICGAVLSCHPHDRLPSLPRRGWLYYLFTH